MMAYTAHDYRIYTGLDRVTGEFVAVVREFPGLSWVSSVSRGLAADGLRQLLSEVLDDMLDDGDVAPKPNDRPLEVDEVRDLQLA